MNNRDLLDDHLIKNNQPRKVLTYAGLIPIVGLIIYLYQGLARNQLICWPTEFDVKEHGVYNFYSILVIQTLSVAAAYKIILKWIIPNIPTEMIDFFASLV